VLRDLNPDARGRYIVLGKDAQEPLRIIVAEKLGGSGIDRHPHEAKASCEPRPHVPGNRTLHQLTDLGSQIIVIESFLETLRQAQATSDRAIAKQCLEPDDRAPIQRHDRLIMRDDAVLRDDLAGAGELQRRLLHSL
jgi:hypothetical protein